MKNIIKLRNEIDNVDDRIFKLLEKRFKITNKIISEKKKKNIIIKDDIRENELINKQINKFRLNKEFVNNIYKLIFKESKKLKC